MNPFVAYMQYLASLEENTEASRTVPSSALIAHDVIPCDGAYESDGGAPYFCSPLLMPSPSLSNDVPNIPPLDSSHSEGPAASLLFQPSRSTFPTTSPDINYYPVTLGHCNSNPPPSDACAQSFEAIVYTLADEALSLAQSDSLKEQAHKGVLENGFSLLRDAREAVALRQSIVLTEIGFHLEEIRAKLRVYDGDSETLTAITSKLDETEASRELSLGITALPHPSSKHGRLSFLERNGHLLFQMQPMLDATMRLRQEATEFVTDHLSFSWRYPQSYASLSA